MNVVVPGTPEAACYVEESSPGWCSGIARFCEASLDMNTVDVVVVVAVGKEC